MFSRFLARNMKCNKKCIKCGADNWEGKTKGFLYIYQCKKCGYIFDWVDYITVGKIDASQITTIQR